MKKSITILLLLISIPTITHAGWWSDLFGKKTLNNTTSQKNVNTNTTNTTIGDTKNTIEGDKNTINVPDEQKSYILNFKDLDTIFGEKLSDANKTASQGVLYLGKSNEIINKASNDNVKQSKENTDVISKNLLEIKEVQGGFLKLGTDYPGIQTTVNIPTATQTLLETLNANIVTPLVSLGAKIESLTNQSLLNNNALISAINNMSSIPSSGGSVPTITQTAHGFVVGDWVYLVGTVYTKTTSNLAASADSVGVVMSIPTANTFTLLTEGYATGLSGLTAGTRYYLGATAGAITATAPSSNIKAVFIADSATSGWVQQYAVGAGSVAAEYVEVLYSTTSSTNLTTNDHIKYNTVVRQIGSSIIPDTTTGYSNATNGNSLGRFLLQPNRVYEMEGGVGDIAGIASGYINYRWWNADTNTEINAGTGGASIIGANLSNTNATSDTAITTFAPTVATRVELRIQTVSNITSYGGGFAYNKATARIKVISGLLPVTGTTVDYLKVKRTTTSQSLALNTDILFNSIPTGNISYNSGTGLATLTANKTYKIKSRLVARNDGTGTTGRYITYEIYTSANAVLPTTANPTTGIQMLATSILNEGGGSEATAEFTPTTNTDIKIRITGIDGSNWTLDQDRSYLEITQLGSTATTTTTRVNVIARNKTAQSLPSGAWTALTNWTEVQDPTSSFDPVTGVFTAPRTTTYQFSTGNTTPPLFSGNYFGQSVFLNGATQLYNFLTTAGGPVAHYPQTSGTIEMTAGQTLQARTYNGGATGNDTPSISNSWFTITEINSQY